MERSTVFAYQLGIEVNIHLQRDRDRADRDLSVRVKIWNLCRQTYSGTKRSVVLFDL